MIEIKNLSYEYQQKKALSNINLTIHDGEFVAVIGSNGSGKSTLAKHLNALLLPSEGNVLIDGLDTKDEKNLLAIRQKIGMVFQNPDNQIIAAQVEEDVAFAPENLGLPSEEIKKRVDEALQAVNMEEFRQHAPHLLSGGQKQRVAIAGALAMLPECLVLDEPTAMLDPQGRQEVLQTIKKLHETKHMTIFLITHFMEEVSLASRVLVMEKGSILFDDTPREIFSNVEKIKSLGLDVPLPVEIAFRLKLKPQKKILTQEDLIEELCRLK